MYVEQSKLVIVGDGIPELWWSTATDGWLA
jgi:hypothetical protein